MVNGECMISYNSSASQSVITDGVIIDDDIIIGAGSLVRKSIVEKGICSDSPTILKIKVK